MDVQDIQDGVRRLGVAGMTYGKRRAPETRTSWHIADDLSHESSSLQSRTGPASLLQGNYGRVPRVYIECALDNAVTPELAREMYATLPCAEVITMPTGHSPFLSAPGELARHLDGLARYAAPG